MTTDPSEPSPSPQADLPAAMREVSVPMTSFVRGGGTITSAYEQQLQAQQADAEYRRAEEEKRRQATLIDPNARLSTTKIGGTKSHAAIVLEWRNSDGKAEEFITCELMVDDKDEAGLQLVLCCLPCSHQRGMAQSQMTLRSKHRGFELDTRRQGEIWVNPNNPEEFVTLAGTIHSTEAFKCPVCSQAYRIDNSVLRFL